MMGLVRAGGVLRPSLWRLCTEARLGSLCKAGSRARLAAVAAPPAAVPVALAAGKTGRCRPYVIRERGASSSVFALAFAVAASFALASAVAASFPIATAARAKS